VCWQQQPKCEVTLLFLGRAGSHAGALVATSSFPQLQGAAPACASWPLITAGFEPSRAWLLLPPSSIASLFFPALFPKGLMHHSSV